MWPEDEDEEEDEPTSWAWPLLGVVGTTERSEGTEGEEIGTTSCTH